MSTRMQLTLNVVIEIADSAAVNLEALEQTGGFQGDNLVLPNFPLEMNVAQVMSRRIIDAFDVPSSSIRVKAVSANLDQAITEGEAPQGDSPRDSD